MAKPLPIHVQEHFQLPTLGITPANINFDSLTLGSDRYICIRESRDEKNTVAIVNTTNTSNILRRAVTADTIALHPEGKILALGAGRQVQLFNLETKTKIKSYEMCEDIKFWKWISSRTLALVTAAAVYHWPLEGDLEPVKIFDRHTSMGECKIINYRASSDEKWMVLVGIFSQGDRDAGVLQLYSKDAGVSQSIEGHAAAFSEIKLDGASSPTKLFVFAVRTSSASKLQIVEIAHVDGNSSFTRKVADIFFPPEFDGDFPAAVQISPKHSIVYVITKYGFLHLYDIDTGTCIYMNRLSGATVFATAACEATGGFVAVNRSGQFFSTCVDETNLVPYIADHLGDPELALKVATRTGVPGTDELYVKRFRRLYQAGKYTEAVKTAATSPGDILRTPQTIEQLKRASGDPAPIRQYFSILLEKGELNRKESIELVKSAVAQGRKDLLGKWIKEDKLECSEELGDLIKLQDTNMAFTVYFRANVHVKAVFCLVELEQYIKIFQYAEEVGYAPDYPCLLQHVLRMDPDGGDAFATLLINNKSVDLVTLEKIVDLYLTQNLVNQATAFLLRVLKDNLPQHAQLQTRLLEMSLKHDPQVAEAIFSDKTLTHYDRASIAIMCEKAGLYQRALEHYTDDADSQRILAHSHLLKIDRVFAYFESLSVKQSLASLYKMLNANTAQNLPIVIQIAIKYSDKLGPAKLIDLLESHKAYEGLYDYLGAVVNTSQDAEVIFKYIEAACKTGHIKEVERICCENKHYSPDKVKDLLKSAKLNDQLPLITVYDRFDSVQDLVLYLHQNNLYKDIETYIQTVNPSRTPDVIGALLDVGCDESIIKKLLMSVRDNMLIRELVDLTEKRNHLQLLMPWLEAKMSEGSKDTEVYNTLAKIYIDSDNNPETFLKCNVYYDSKTIGKYCEKRDPRLAYIAYERGKCDMELMDLTNNNSMIKQQTRYLVKRCDLDLWAYVLRNNNPRRRVLIDEVTATAVPESQDPEEVSVAVKAFMDAYLPIDLINLLEQIVFKPTAFADLSNLQNLLILTAIQVDKAKVMTYVKQLHNFSAQDVADHAVQNCLFEEAFVVHQDNNNHISAMNVLIEHIGGIDRAHEYAKSVDTPEVWSRLGEAQLDAHRIKDSIDSYIHANNPVNFDRLILLASRAEFDDNYEDLVRYLEMARRAELREARIDTELLFAYATTGRFADKEQLLQSPNIADVQKVGDRCFINKMYGPAKSMYSKISDWADLAPTLAQLGEFQAAVDSAHKASRLQVWKHVNAICVEHQEFEMAKVCGEHLVVNPVELEELIHLYEDLGYGDQLIDVLETGLEGVITNITLHMDLAILYTKYRHECLMEYLKKHWRRIVDIPKAIRSCEDAHLWAEAVFLHKCYNECGMAAQGMMKHPSDAWDHSAFKELIDETWTREYYCDALRFYLEEQPLLLNDLLAALTPYIDHACVVDMFRELDQLLLIREYLASVQPIDDMSINTAYHDLLIDEEDFERLCTSVDTYTNFDGLALAHKLKSHALLEFRRIATHLFKRSQKWSESVALSKQDRLYRDAMETVAESRDTALAEELLHYFVEKGNKECFGACYDAVRPDVVMELAWRNDLQDVAMPYMVQVAREWRNRMEVLEKKVQELEVKVQDVGHDKASASETQTIRPGECQSTM
ncbi:hypothetical protein BG000_007014 [Podila horticola]|nr:hypothetical protein BG000_007014 [Podila horticola]